MIFALMAAVGYRGLDSVLSARAHLEHDGRKWRDLALAFASIEQAMGAAVDARVRASDGRIADAFAADLRVRAEEPLLTFTRMGLPGQSGALADLQRVGYRLRGERFEQLLWPVLDAAPRSEPQAQALLTGVESLELRYLAADGSWHASWPPAGTPAAQQRALPAAVEIALRSTSGEQFLRLFALP